MQLKPTSNITEVIQALQALQNKGTNMRPVFAKIANELLNVTEESFESETSPWGEPWQPLAEATIAQKAKAGKDTRILSPT